MSKNEFLRNPDLKTLRVFRKYTQAQLADSIGVDQTSFSRFERGEVSPNLDVSVRLAKVLGVSLKTLAKSLGYDVSDLLNDEDE